MSGVFTHSILSLKKKKLEFGIKEKKKKIPLDLNLQSILAIPQTSEVLKYVALRKE